MTHGVRDSILFKYSQTDLKPAQFWNPAESWRNKYKDYPIDKSPKFIGAKTFLVALTDGSHLLVFIETAFFMIAVLIGDFKRCRFRYLVLLFFAFKVLYGGGSELMMYLIL